MIGRGAAFLAACTWLLLGFALAVISAVSLSLNHLPCMQNSPVCAAFNRFVLYDLLFGRVNTAATQTIIGLLPLLLLALATLMFFTSLFLFRYALFGEPLAAISLALGLHSLVLVLLLWANLALGTAVAYWDAGSANTPGDPPAYELYGEPLNAAQWERLRTYPTAAARIHFWSLAAAGWAALLTAGLYRLRPAPARPTLYAGGENACSQCGLTDSGCPQCALCQPRRPIEVETEHSA